MNLEILQTILIRQVVGGDNDDTINFLQQLKPCGNLSASRQIEIYRSNVQGALISTLKHIYPVCVCILGERYFSQMSEEFIHKYPSDFADLDHYGQSFPYFIQTLLTHRSELLEFPYLADLAQLEQFYHDSYFVKNDTAFDFKQLTGLSEGDYQQLHFQLSAALKLMKTSFPVLSIWQINRALNTLNDLIKMPEDVQSLVVFRQNFRVEVESISTHLYHFLDTLAKGASFVELLNQFESVADFDVTHHLTALVSKGWITGFKVADV